MTYIDRGVESDPSERYLEVSDERAYLVTKIFGRRPRRVGVRLTRYYGTDGRVSHERYENTRWALHDAGEKIGSLPFVLF